MGKSHSILRGLPLVVLGAALVLGVGCAAGPVRRSPFVHPVVKQAPSDLECPSEQLRYEEFDDSSIGVSGCDKRARYVRICYTVFEYGTHGPSHTECKWQKD